jgi:hypothetical protein
MTLAPAAASLPEPLPKTARAATTELRRRLEVPPGTTMKKTRVDTGGEDQILHVAAFRPVTLDGRGLEGVRLMVPGVTRVSTTRGGRSMTGTLGEVTPALGDVEAQARAFARSLLENGDIVLREESRGRNARSAGRRMAPPQPSGTRPPGRPTHVIKIVRGQPELQRRGFR